MLNNLPSTAFQISCSITLKMNINYLTVTCLLHAQFRRMTAGFVSNYCGYIDLQSVEYDLYISAALIARSCTICVVFTFVFFCE